MKRRLMMAATYAVAAVILVMLCTGGMLLTDLFAAKEPPPNGGSVSGETVAGGSVTVQIGEPLLIDVKGTQPIAWESDNEEVVSVDSGGRLDAVAAGTAKVTARYPSGRSVVYTVTAAQAAAKPQPDIYSTAITANEDIMRKNQEELGLDSHELYHVMVNRLQNVVTVYTRDEKGDYTVPVRAMVCSCGLNKATITGEFRTFYNIEWETLFNDVYGQYATGIDGNFLFHSVPYKEMEKKDSLEAEEFNKLGEEASLGCVRLAVSDAKWIYDNCMVGTFVSLYDSDKPEPLGKPEPIRIADTKIKWDPTDNVEDNPYNDKTPVITLPDTQRLAVGAHFDPMEGVRATDTCGSDVTDKVEVIGNVVTSHRGEFRLTYRVTDALHRTAEETKIIWVG